MNNFQTEVLTDLKLSDILLRCYECIKPVNKGDLRVTGKKFGVIGYFHPNCWKKYKKNKAFQELLLHLKALKERKVRYCIHCGHENKYGSLLLCADCLSKEQEN